MNTLPPITFLTPPPWLLSPHPPSPLQDFHTFDQTKSPQQEGDGWQIGVFDSSFNPPHLGHAHMILQSVISLKLDCVILLLATTNAEKVM
jgi:ATP sulfurylase